MKNRTCGRKNIVTWISASQNLLYAWVIFSNANFYSVVPHWGLRIWISNHLLTNTYAASLWIILWGTKIWKWWANLVWWRIIKESRMTPRFLVWYSWQKREKKGTGNIYWVTTVCCFLFSWDSTLQINSFIHLLNTYFLSTH